MNREKNHVLVFPEDDANRQLANGFHLQVASNLRHCMRVLPVAGGWHEVLGLFVSDHVAEMERWPLRFMILLIDLDNHPNRLGEALQEIPPHLRDRVFILGVLSEPERLKAALNKKPLELIGSELADDCRNGVVGNWDHDLLKHNAPELNRLRNQLCPILFPG